MITGPNDHLARTICELQRRAAEMYVAFDATHRTNRYAVDIQRIMAETHAHVVEMMSWYLDDDYMEEWNKNYLDEMVRTYEVGVREARPRRMPGA